MGMRSDICGKANVLVFNIHGQHEQCLKRVHAVSLIAYFRTILSDARLHSTKLQSRFEETSLQLKRRRSSCSNSIHICR
jgi:hypothetical protein